MLSLITKLDLGEEEKMKLHQELEGHTPTILKEVRDKNGSFVTRAFLAWVWTANIFFQLKRRLDELEVLKVEKIGQIIEATRRELRDLWDACYYGQEQREKFASYYSDSHTEELLEEHEKVDQSAMWDIYICDVSLLINESCKKKQKTVERLTSLSLCVCRVRCVGQHEKNQIFIVQDCPLHVIFTCREGTNTYSSSCRRLPG